MKGENPPHGDIHLLEAVLTYFTIPSERERERKDKQTDRQTDSSSCRRKRDQCNFSWLAKINVPRSLVAAFEMSCEFQDNKKINCVPKVRAVRGPTWTKQ